MQTIAAGDADFWSRVDALATSDAAERADVREAAESICRDVRERGDAAVLEYTRRFDRRDDLAGVAELRLSPEAMAQAFESLDAAARDTLVRTHERLVRFAEQQVATSWRITDDIGCELGEQITPLDRAGLYVPGGKASYPSSLLMNAVPARVAGVRELVMVAPTPDGQINPWVLAAAHLVGIDHAFCIGGAQAVAAMAYGTETVPAVDKIVGPGNAYVTAAKRHVFGAVGIDKLAGPSEILVICDGQTDVDWTVLDLFSQAEHDEDAQAVLVCPDADYLAQVRARADEMARAQLREAIIRASLAARGALIHVENLAQAAEVANRLAPEHLELSVADPDGLLPSIRHAGAIFLGRHTPEAFGDYCAGPNHVLPTGRGARFSSPLGVQDFQKRSSLIKVSPAAAAQLAPLAGHFADVEGLAAHAESARRRGGGV
ncbi:MAG: histidinol dehydrogenase [Xanthomonadales bacterium]|nr:histidinol dehydrogenase [Xanthomonadales bacterium]